MVLSCIYGPRFHYSKRTCRPGGCFPFVRRRNSVSAEHGKARTAVLPTSTQDVAVQGNASASASASASGTALDESPGAVPAAKLQPKGKRPSLAANHPYGPHAINKARLKELEQLPKLGPFIDLPERPTLPQTAARRRGSRVGGNGNVGGGGGGGGSNNGSSSAVSLAYSSSESLGATGDSNRAALAYTAARKEELSFRAGDMITFNAVTWRDGWIYATNERNGKVGYLSLRVFETHVMGRSTPAGGMLTNVANVDINVMAPVDMNDQ
ncbi:hypothetical protein BC831DRAFT_249812 [Entophlyctis helioformis]|nr:hypothetical protein BC831DRAFT_249812 [Entophlyctis helioformis]